jgi:hypothetical protein
MAKTPQLKSGNDCWIGSGTGSGSDLGSDAIFAKDFLTLMVGTGSLNLAMVDAEELQNNLQRAAMERIGKSSVA